MDIVLDTSAIIAFVANEPERPTIIGLTAGSSLIAPASVHWEIGHAFSAMFKRQRISLESALSALSVYRAIPIRFVDVELAPALQIAAGEKIYAYDAYVLQCALKFRAPILTLDDDLGLLAGKLGIRVLEVQK